MKPQGAHAHEDRLLDFAYGELPPSEARLVEQHVEGCSRCSEALAGIRSVRTTMSRLPLEPAPDAGLESLLAYAQQSARRAAAGPEPAPRWWRRLLAPALGMAAMSLFGIVVVQVNREVDLSPVLAKESAADAPSKPAAPEPPAAAPTAAQVPAETGKLHEQFDDKSRDALATGPMPAKSPPKPVRRTSMADWSNAGAGSAGGFPEKKPVLDGDEESKDLGGLGTRGLSKRKGSVPVRKSLPSMPAEGRAEPAREEALAEAELAAQYAPPSPKQQIIGSASRPASVASEDPADDFAQQAPGRAQVASAAPPPPPSVQAQPSSAAIGSFAQAERVESKKAEVARKPAQKAAMRISPSTGELLQQADVAQRSGDWAQEVAFLRAALASGVQGAQLLDVLSRLCDAEFALGRRQNAIEVCNQVMRLAPDSSEARLAQRRLERELRSPADEADSAPKAASPATR